MNDSNRNNTIADTRTLVRIILNDSNRNNTIADVGSTAPLYCLYHTEVTTIEEHKRDRKDVRGPSAYAPLVRRLLHWFLLKLGNN